MCFPLNVQTAEFLAIAELSSGGGRDSGSNDIVRLAAPLSAVAIDKYLKALIRESTVRTFLCSHRQISQGFYMRKHGAYFSL